jgi:hypothetical protein
VRSGYRAFQRQAKICDELGMFLRAWGASIALFLERSKGWFTRPKRSEHGASTRPSPASQAHVSRIFAALGTAMACLRRR